MSKYYRKVQEEGFKEFDKESLVGITKQDMIDFINKMEIKKVRFGGLDKVDVYFHIQQIAILYDAYLKQTFKAFEENCTCKKNKNETFDLISPVIESKKSSVLESKGKHEIEKEIINPSTSTVNFTDEEILILKKLAERNKFLF